MNGEDVETKAGRAPALKVGGCRVVTRHRTSSEEVKAPSDPEEDGGEEEEGTKAGKEKNPQLVLWGQKRDEARDFPSQAVQERQCKPLPTHPPHDTRPATAKPNIIQQPRK